MSAQLRSLVAGFAVAAIVLIAVRVAAGPLSPPAGPIQSTGVTLAEIAQGAQGYPVGGWTVWTGSTTYAGDDAIAPYRATVAAAGAQGIVHRVFSLDAQSITEAFLYGGWGSIPFRVSTGSGAPEGLSLSNARFVNGLMIRSSSPGRFIVLYRPD